MSDKPNTPIIIDDGENVTVKYDEVAVRVSRDLNNILANRSNEEIIVALAEEVNRLRDKNDALKKQVNSLWACSLVHPCKSSVASILYLPLVIDFSILLFILLLSPIVKA